MQQIHFIELIGPLMQSHIRVTKLLMWYYFPALLTNLYEWLNLVKDLALTTLIFVISVLLS